MERVKALAGRVSRILPVRVLVKFIDDDGPNHAVLIAWNGLFSLFPIILALVAIAGYVLAIIGMDAFSLTKLVVTFIPADPAAQRQALDALNSLAERRGPLALVALVGFLWAASGLFGAMENAFDRIFDCPHRDFVRQKLMSLAMMGIFTILAIVAIGTSAIRPLLESAPSVKQVLDQGPSTALLQAIIGTVAGLVMFLVLYRVVPNCKLRLRRIWPGALVAGVAFEALTLVFPFYISLNKGISQYGQAFALLFVLMFFFFFVGIITVIGAEINSILLADRPDELATRESEDQVRDEAGQKAGQ